jgi:hypothetical protein
MNTSRTMEWMLLQARQSTPLVFRLLKATVPGEIENIIKELKVGEDTKRKKRVPGIVGLELNKKAGNKKGTRSNPDHNHSTRK